MPTVSVPFVIWQMVMANLQNHRKKTRVWGRRGREGARKHWYCCDRAQTGQQTCKPNNGQTPSNNANCVHTKKLVKKRAEAKDGEDADEDKDMNERLGASVRKRKCNRSAKFGSDRYCGVYAIYEKNMLFLATFYFLPQLLVCGVVYLFLCVVCRM